MATESPKLVPGLVSVTYRQLGIANIVRAAARAGLQAVEWGGDVHVPHGDLGAARQAARLTRAAGLEVACYGSYYRAGCDSPGDGTFERVMETARELHAPAIRVWAGNRASADADTDWRARVVDDLLRISEAAAGAHMVVATEFHGRTLTDTDASTQSLLRAAEHPNLKTLWQPPPAKSPKACLASLRLVQSRLQHLHVFHRQPDVGTRLPLSEGAGCWPAYLRAAVTGERPPRFALLEFVCDDNPHNLDSDAATLRKWIDEINSGVAPCTEEPT